MHSTPVRRGQRDPHPLRGGRDGPARHPAPRLTDYVERFRDVDVDRLITQFGLSVEEDLGVKNKYVAVGNVDELGLTEDLNDPLVLDEDHDQTSDENDGAPATTPDEDLTDGAD